MFFPVSGIECHPLVPVLAAMGISFVTSMGGLSGAFLLLPFQMSFLGYTSPGVSATNHLFNVLACPGGIVRYAREGRLLWPLALTVAVGTLPGIVLGSLIRVYWLPDESRFKVFAGLLLLWIFWRTASYIKSAAATEALRELTRPNMGICTRTSHVSFTKWDMPRPSLPMTRTIGSVREL